VAPAAAGAGEERVLVSSMTQLAQDMHAINGRVNKLTSLVEVRERQIQGRRQTETGTGTETETETGTEKTCIAT
jgi:hypothetical protein